MKTWVLICGLAWLWTGFLHAAEPLREGRRSAYLQGLGLERRGFYNPAKNEYRRLPLDSAKRQERLFLLGLESQPTAQAPGPEALAQQVRYLVFQGYYGEAYSLLFEQPGRGFQNAELDQQRAQMSLWFGHLKRAKKYLDRAHPETEALRLEQMVLRFWLAFLSHQDQEALAQARQMGQEMLYLPYQALPLTAESIQRWVLLYPESSPLLDQWVARLVETGQWEELALFCRQQQARSLPSPKAGYCQAARLLTQAKSYQDLSSWVRGRSVRPELLEQIAQWVIAQKDWEGLARLGQDMDRHYPELEDGRLYGELALSRSSGE